MDSKLYKKVSEKASKVEIGKDKISLHFDEDSFTLKDMLDAMAESEKDK
jgi:hypothetical protein